MLEECMRKLEQHRYSFHSETLKTKNAQGVEKKTIVIHLNTSLLLINKYDYE